MAAKGFIEVDKQACKGCELCATVCPVKCIGYAKTTNNKGYYYSQMENERNRQRIGAF